jgi:hypothetical protein
MNLRSEDIWNRGNNLVATATLAIAGLAFLPEFFVEDDLINKIDDGLLFIIGIVAVIWYRTGFNKYTRSKTIIYLTIAALVTKIGGILMEITDKTDMGDDFGGTILFISACVLIIMLYRHKQNTLSPINTQ